MADHERRAESEQLARERALAAYVSAFERGDFDTMEEILQKAMEDAELEQLIMEAHEYYLEAEHFSLPEAELERLRQLVWQALKEAGVTGLE